MRKAIYYLITAMAFLSIACGRRSGGDDGPSTITSLKMNGEDISGVAVARIFYSAPFVIDLEFTTKYRGGKYFLKLEEGGDYKVTIGNTTYTQADFIPIPEFGDLLKKLSFSVEVEGTRKVFKPNIYFLDNESEGPRLLPRAFNQGFRMEVVPTSEGEGANTDFEIILSGDTSINNAGVGIATGIGIKNLSDSNYNFNAISVVAENKEQFTYEYSITVKVKPGSQKGDVNTWAYTAPSGVLNSGNNYTSRFNIRFISGNLYAVVGEYEVTVLFRRSDNFQVPITKNIRFIDDRLDFSIVSNINGQNLTSVELDQYTERSLFAITYETPEERHLGTNGVMVTYKYDPAYIRLWKASPNATNPDEELLPNVELTPARGTSLGNLAEHYVLVGVQATDETPIEVTLKDKNGAQSSRSIKVKVLSKPINDFITYTPRLSVGNGSITLSSVETDKVTAKAIPNGTAAAIHSRQDPRFSIAIGGAGDALRISSKIAWDAKILFRKTYNSSSAYVLNTSLAQEVPAIPILNNSTFQNTNQEVPRGINTSANYIVSSIDDNADNVSFDVFYQVIFGFNNERSSEYKLSYQVHKYVPAVWNATGVTCVGGGWRYISETQVPGPCSTPLKDELYERTSSATGAMITQINDAIFGGGVTAINKNFSHQESQRRTYGDCLPVPPVPSATDCPNFEIASPQIGLTDYWGVRY